MRKILEKLEVLKKVFGYDSFREGQEKIIDAILRGQDVLGIMPTGAGKSICYQVPALMFPGITVVVSPLISLMIDFPGESIKRCRNPCGIYKQRPDGNTDYKGTLQCNVRAV
mgnify:CR=1 FL=1